MIADFRKATKVLTPEEREFKKIGQILATAPRSTVFGGGAKHYLEVHRAVRCSTRRELARTVWSWRKGELKARSERPTVRGRRGLVAASAGA